MNSNLTLNLSEYLSDYKTSKYSEIIIKLGKKSKYLVEKTLKNKKENYLKIGDTRSKEVTPKLIDYLLSKL